MKALFAVPGPSGGIFEFRDIPTPTPGAGEVVVKVGASGTNRGELLIIAPGLERFGEQPDVDALILPEIFAQRQLCDELHAGGINPAFREHAQNILAGHSFWRQQNQPRAGNRMQDSSP